MLKTMFWAKEAPYLLSVMLAAAGWGGTHFVDRVVESPTLEYSMSTQNETRAPEKHITLIMTNLSRNVFSNLTFELRPKCDGCKVSKLLGVAVEAPARPSNKRPEIVDQSLLFTVERMHPGWTMMLKATYTGNAQPELTLKESSDNQPVRLLRPCLETYLTRHENAFLLAIVAIWIISILAWGLLCRGPTAKLPNAGDSEDAP